MCCLDHLVYTFSPLSVFCQRCRVCTECGVRGLVLPGLAQWFDNYAVCEGCQHHRSSLCGVCSKAANPSVALQCCSMCHRLIQCASAIAFIGNCHVWAWRSYCHKIFHLDDLLMISLFYCLRWVHSECALPGELPEAKCICLLCKENQQQQPATQTYTAEIQTREASEETEGHLVEMTIQTDADTMTEEQTDLSEVTPRQRGTSVTVQDEATVDKETPMELGKSESDTT